MSLPMWRYKERIELVTLPVIMWRCVVRVLHYGLLLSCSFRVSVLMMGSGSAIVREFVE